MLLLFVCCFILAWRFLLLAAEGLGPILDILYDFKTFHAETPLKYH